MNELPSTEFRKRFARLSEPTVVTANGHMIGTWTPALTPSQQFRDAEKQRIAKVPEHMQQTPQAKRDELLGKINRGK